MPTNTPIRKAITQAQQTMMQGHLQDALDIMQTALETPPADERDQLEALLVYGHLLTRAIFFVNGDGDAARAVLNQARQLAENQQDDAALAQALDQIGMTYYYEQLGQTDRNFDTAKSHFEQALALCQAGADDRIHSEAVFHLGLVAQFSGKPAEAQAHFEQAAALAADYPIEKSYAVRHLGFLAGANGDLEAAEKHLKESLHLRQQANYRIGLAFSHLSVGNIALESEQYEEALEHFQEALALSEALDNLRGSALSWLSVGQAYEGLEDKEQARNAYTTAQTLSQQVGHAAAAQAAAERLAVLAAE